MSAKKNTTENTDTTTETPVVPAVDLSAALVEIPARICVQIGERKRYFDTREAALEALQAFEAKKAGKGMGPKRVFLTPEQKAEKLARRAPLMGFAATQGLEGKKAAMLANTLEELIAVIPEIFPLVAAYVEANPVPVKEVTEGEVPEGAEAPVETSKDPLAEFNM